MNKLRLLTTVAVVVAIALVAAWFFMPTALAPGPVFDFAGAQLERIERTQGPDTVRLVRGEARWLIESPRADWADPDRLDELLAALVQLEGLAVDADADSDSLGLDSPTMVLTVKTTRAEHRLVLGVLDAKGSHYFAQVDDDEPLIVAAAELEPLLWDPDCFRARQVVPFAAPDIRSLTVSADDLELSFAKDAGRWWLSNPEGRELADQARVAQLVEELAGLTVAGFPEATGVDEPFTPTAWVSLGGDREADDTVLFLGRFQGKDLVVAQVQGRPAPFLLAAPPLTEIHRFDGRGWLSTRLLELPPGPLVRFSLEEPYPVYVGLPPRGWRQVLELDRYYRPIRFEYRPVYVLERKEEDFRFLDPTAGPAHQATARSLSEDITQIRLDELAVRWQEPGHAWRNLSPLGLWPGMRLTASTAEVTARATLGTEVGASGLSFHAHREGEPRVFVVSLPSQHLLHAYPMARERRLDLLDDPEKLSQLVIQLEEQPARGFRRTTDGTFEGPDGAVRHVEQMQPVLDLLANLPIQQYLLPSIDLIVAGLDPPWLRLQGIDAEEREMFTLEVGRTVPSLNREPATSYYARLSPDPGGAPYLYLALFKDDVQGRLVAPLAPDN